MEVIGFFALCILMLYPTGVALLFFVATVPAYSIGGMPNGWFGRIATLIGCAIVAYGWYKLFQYAPFHIALNK